MTSLSLKYFAMQAIIVIIIMCFVDLMDTRPQNRVHYNLVFWNYFPFQHVIQQPDTQPAYLQYPTFKLIFQTPTHNMPSEQEIPSFTPPVDPPIRKLKPQNPATSKTTTTSTSTTQPTPTSTPTAVPLHSNDRRTSLNQSTPPVAKPIKFQLADGIFEMARNIQANTPSNNGQQPIGKFNVFSPINVATLLSLLELGAKHKTNHELQHILGFDSLPFPNHHSILGQMLKSITQTTTDAAQINMANGIFIQTGYSMEPDYRTSAETIYQSQVTELDFQQRPAQATEFINNWVRRQTNGKIQNILNDGIDKTTRMLLASVVHFKALWMTSFIPAATTKRPFYSDGKESDRTIMVETMVNGGEFKYHESQEYECRIMALPFKGHTTTMYIILPEKSNADRLKRLQAELSHDAINSMIEKMKVHRALITLPRMQLSDTVDLKDILMRIGVASVFDSTQSDLSGMTGDQRYGLFVDGIVHKIDLTINETGTEAAAATVTNLSREDFDIEFRVDEPFIFLIRHEDTRMPLFYGSVTEPVAL